MLISRIISHSGCTCYDYTASSRVSKLAACSYESLLAAALRKASDMLYCSAVSSVLVRASISLRRKQQIWHVLSKDRQKAQLIN